MAKVSPCQSGGAVIFMQFVEQAHPPGGPPVGPRWVGSAGLKPPAKQAQQQERTFSASLLLLKWASAAPKSELEASDRA